MSDQNDSSAFGGSVDRSRLEEMKAAAGDDPERQRQVAEVQAQVDAVAESDAAAEKARQDLLDAQQPSAAEEQAAEQPTVTEPAVTQPEPAPESGGRPAQADNKAAWVDWAVGLGVDRDEAEGYTKAELVELYGSD